MSKSGFEQGLQVTNKQSVHGKPVKSTPEVCGGTGCLRGMQESALSDNERDQAAPVRFALRLKAPIRGSFEGKGRDSHADHRSIDCKKSR